MTIKELIYDLQRERDPSKAHQMVVDYAWKAWADKLKGSPQDEFEKIQIPSGGIVPKPDSGALDILKVAAQDSEIVAPREIFLKSLHQFKKNKKIGQN